MTANWGNPVADWGVVLVETDIDRAVVLQLSTWINTYLTQAERERSLDDYLLARPRPESFHNALEDDTFPDTMLPCLVVTTAATEGDPRQTPYGSDVSYMAEWRVNVSAVVRGRTPPECREIAAIYGGAVRALLCQQQLDIEGSRLLWRGSAVTALSNDPQGRYLAQGFNRFTVTTDQALTGDGPVVPTEDDPPYPPPDPTDPDAVYDPLAEVRVVTTQIVPRS